MYLDNIRLVERKYQLPFDWSSLGPIRTKEGHQDLGQFWFQDNYFLKKQKDEQRSFDDSWDILRFVHSQANVLKENVICSKP